MAPERQRIKLDLETLFPGETIEIGEQSLVIRPLGLIQLATITKKLKGYGEILKKEGVTWENYNEAENMLKITNVLIEQFPDVLEEASNIHKDDLFSLPIEVVIDILSKVIEVNLSAKEKLEGNFKNLGTRLNLIAPQEKKIAEETEEK